MGITLISRGISKKAIFLCFFLVCVREKGRMPVLLDGQRVIPASVRALSGLPRVGSFQLAIRLLISNEFILDPTSPHLLSSLAQQLVMQPEKKMLLIPEFPSSVLALKISCPSLSLPPAVPGFSIAGWRKAMLEIDTSLGCHCSQTWCWGMEGKGRTKHRMTHFALAHIQNKSSYMAFCVTSTKGLPCICSCLNYYFSLSKPAKFN